MCTRSVTFRFCTARQAVYIYVF
uniref:Uncharacterized protein n=1 Tax=Anguilla anguilla TaxID=7936 RepID=A0A0E9UMF4_ANGAN